MERIINRKLRYTKRWFAYFDLLGFANLVRTSEIESVLPIYETVLKAIEEKAEPKKAKGIGYSWFSDTFIMFSKGSSLEEFVLIEQISRLFFQKLILKKIPVRGSISYGKLYTQQDKNIFLGEALIDAYEYGENQNWLNFIITPSAYEALKKLNSPMEGRPNYRLIEDSKVITHKKIKNVFAYAFNNEAANPEKPFLSALNKMKETSPKTVSLKYENTINFINKNNGDRLF